MDKTEYEHKKKFVEGLGELLHNHSRTGVSELRYYCKEYDPEVFYGRSILAHRGAIEAVEILYNNNNVKIVDVSADSALAIMNDIYRALV